MLINFPRMIKADRNMSDLWQIMSKKHNFNIIAFVGFIVWITGVREPHSDVCVSRFGYPAHKMYKHLSHII